LPNPGTYKDIDRKKLTSRIQVIIIIFVAGFHFISNSLLFFWISFTANYPALSHKNQAFCLIFANSMSSLRKTFLLSKDFICASLLIGWPGAFAGSLD